MIDDWANNGKNSDGFLVFHPKSFKKGDYSYKKDGGVAYLSQFGLQGRIYSFIAQVFQINTYAKAENLFKILRELNAFLLSATLALFVTAIKREFGFWQAILVGLSLASSNGIILFAKNLYWVSFTTFLPFSLYWYFYPKIRNKYLIVSLTAVSLILLKSLNGYEFLTSVTLSMLTPIMFYEFKDRKKIKYFILKFLFFLFMCILGFLIALTIHLFATTAHVGSFEEAFSIVRGRAVERTLTYIPFPMKSFLSQNVYTIPFTTKGFRVYWLILIMLFFYPIYKQVNRYIFTEIDLLLLLSILSTTSWFIFGYQHIAWHSWAFYLTINLCFLPIISLFFANLIVLQLNRLKLITVKKNNEINEYL